MKKFAVIIDHTANSIKGGYSQHLLEAKTLPEAMSEAEKFFDEDVYMMHIAVKTGKTVKDKEFGYKSSMYTAVLANRHNGWHTVDEKHSEQGMVWEHQDWKNFEQWVMVDAWKIFADFKN